MSQHDDPELQPIYRMPATLGAAAGPRNMPTSKEHLRFTGDVVALCVVALSDADALTRVLPPRCRLLGEPILEAHFMMQHNLGWLAGRGYNFLTMRIPAVFEGKNGEVQGNYCPVLWENMADPIITGRDELGSPKLFANLPNPVGMGDSYAASADWEGFRFFDMQLGQLKPATTPLQPSLPNMLYRYHARTGDWQKADIAQMTIARKGAAPAPKIHEHLVGSGSFAFHPARWEDMPTQYTFINAMASLPLREFRSARVLKMSGIADLAAQEIID
ncbi:MAG: acetoacetate decarboxylase family protein [Steroidobacteraceae bacterium]